MNVNQGQTSSAVLSEKLKMSVVYKVDFKMHKQATEDEETCGMIQKHDSISNRVEVHDCVTDITTVLYRLTDTSFIDLHIFSSLVKNQSLWICFTHHPSQQLNLQSCRGPESIQKSLSIQE